MAQISLHLSDDVEAELERGRAAQEHLPSRSEYVSALILAHVGRVSGLDRREVFQSTAIDGRVGGFITDAITLIGRGDSASAIAALRRAQDILIEAMIPRKPVSRETQAERLRIRGGSSDWAEKP